MTDPTISVIVPVHNMEKYIGRCLSPLLRVRNTIIEIIAVDDGSNDRTNEVLKSFTDSRLKVLTVSRGGPSAARNAGFHYSRGRYILPFDADDIPIIDNWDAVIDVLENHPTAVVVYGSRRVFEGNDDFPRIPTKDNYPAADSVVPLIFRQNFMQMGAAFIRRDAIEQAGLWNENLYHGEDWEMWCRLACLGPFVHCPVLVMGYRRHDQSATGINVSKNACDPGLAAIDVIYSNPAILKKAGNEQYKLKRAALAWRTYFWGTTLIRSGAFWPGIKALGGAVSKDPSRFLFLCNYPMRWLRRRLARTQVISLREPSREGKADRTDWVHRQISIRMHMSRLRSR